MGAIITSDQTENGRARESECDTFYAEVKNNSISKLALDIREGRQRKEGRGGE